MSASPARVFIWSRLATWALALGTLALFGPVRHIPNLAGLAHGPNWSPSWLHDLGPTTDVWARWDSAWFVLIAKHGYAAAAHTEAFYPLYPGLVGVAGRALGGHFVLGAVIVSLAACLGAFVLLHRLAELHLGRDGAWRAVLYVALFPMALFLQAAYSESLFLLCAVATFWLAERGRFAGAAAAAGCALLTRPTGIALVPPLVLFALRAPERRRALASLALVPALFLVYPLALWQQVGDPLAFLHAELDPLWARHLSPAGPLGGIWGGLRAGWAALRQLVSGSNRHDYWPAVHDFTPLHVAAINLEYLLFLALFLALAVVAWRRLGAAYGLYAAVGLAIPLSFPSSRWPLLSMPRFVLVLFPCFLALASLGASRRLHAATVAVSVTLLAVSVVQWSLWEWVA